MYNFYPQRPLLLYIKVHLSCKAQVCVAAALNDIGTTESRMKALPYIENAFRIKQDYAGAWFIKGTIMRELNRKDEAARSFQMTIKHSSVENFFFVFQ